MNEDGVWMRERFMKALWVWLGWKEGIESSEIPRLG